MADVSRYTDMAAHPDVAEMRQRYERISQSGQAVMIDGLVLLAGAWLAISPWVVHFNTTARSVAVNNLILGGLVMVIGLGLTVAPMYMYRLSWATAAIGLWVVASPWAIQGASPPFNVWLTNVCTGGVTALLGAIAATMLMSKRPMAGRFPTRHHAAEAH